MHSVLVRAQNAFGFFTTVAFCTALLTAFSVLLTPQSPSASINLRNVQVVKGRPHYYSPKKEEYAHIKFDLDADFTSLFNWNTKQLFVWITATYPSSNAAVDYPLSKAVIWDTIINSESQLHPFNPLQLFQKAPASSKLSNKAKKSSTTKKQEPKVEPGIIHLKNSKPKYQITDITGVLSERTNVTLEVGWNVQPWVGALTWTFGEGKEFGRWKGVKGGRSKIFDMPPLKGKTASSATIVGDGGTPEAAEATPVV
ncbi:Signal peptidase complex subunit [Lecanora helva]